MPLQISICYTHIELSNIIGQICTGYRNRRNPENGKEMEEKENVLIFSEYGKTIVPCLVLCAS